MLFFKRIHFYYLAFASSLLLSGCSAKYHSIYRSEQLEPDNSMVFTVDAKQRFLLSTLSEKKDQNGTTEKIKKIRRFCAEQSPDVFSVISQAGSGSGSFGQTSDPKAISVALEAAFSSGETGSTITRTQTINMLKEMMYRTCERYLNGQISEYEYPMIAARDQRIMTSILAIEQLTGTVTPKPIVIASTGNSTTGQSTTQAIQSLDEAKKNVSTLKENLDKVQKEFAELNTEEDVCDTLMNKKPEEITDDADRTKRQKCSDMKEKVDKTEKAYNDAKNYYDALLSLAGKPGESSSGTNAALLSSPAITEIDKEIETARLETIKHVSDTVLKIVNNSFNTEDETSFFCYRAIENNLDKNVTRACNHFLLTKVKYDTKLVEKQILETRQQLDEYRKNRFDKFWEKIVSNDKYIADKGKLKDRIDRIYSDVERPSKIKLDSMMETQDKEKISKIFNALPDTTTDQLINN